MRSQRKSKIWTSLLGKNQERNCTKWSALSKVSQPLGNQTTLWRADLKMKNVFEAGDWFRVEDMFWSWRWDLKPKTSSEEKMCFGVKLIFWRGSRVYKNIRSGSFNLVLPEKPAHKTDIFVLLLKNVNIINLLKAIWTWHIKYYRKHAHNQQTSKKDHFQESSTDNSIYGKGLRITYRTGMNIWRKESN
jgi:hypothetical protein